MKTTIGVDLGGTNIGAVLISEAGEVLWENSIPTRREEGYEAVLARMAGLIEGAKAFGTLAGIGVGVPGPVDRVTGRVYECVNLGWGEVDLAVDLSRKAGIPSMLMNDASAAAYGEFAAGALRGVVDGLMLTLGTGVGGGAIIGGHLFEGRHGLGMEVGHIVVGEGEYRCSCGRMGCFETYASASGLVMNAHAHLAKYGPSAWMDARLPIDGKVIMDGAQSGDPFCEEITNRWIHYLAIGVLDLRMVLDPEVIAFGGGLSNAGAYWLSKLEQVISHSANFRNIPLPKLVMAELGEKAGAIGAAHRMMEVISE